jgi:hypothetical protein
MSEQSEKKFAVRSLATTSSFGPFLDLGHPSHVNSSGEHLRATDSYLLGRGILQALGNYLFLVGVPAIDGIERQLQSV